MMNDLKDLVRVYRERVDLALIPHYKHLDDLLGTEIAALKSS